MRPILFADGLAYPQKLDKHRPPNAVLYQLSLQLPYGFWLDSNQRPLPSLLYHARTGLVKCLSGTCGWLKSEQSCPLAHPAHDYSDDRAARVLYPSGDCGQHTEAPPHHKWHTYCPAALLIVHMPRL